MSLWPYDTREKLKAAGYRFMRTDTCLARECCASIEFWRTPKGKLMPLILLEGKMQPHWADCPGAKEFKRA